MNVKKLSGFEYLESQGASGGIILSRNQKLFKLISSQKYKYSISVVLQTLWDAKNILITGVYGPNNRNEKLDFLNEIKTIGENNSLSWMILGDFNLVFYAHERSGQYNNHQYTQEFRELSNELNLIDLPLNGLNYTWKNSIAGARIDRILLNKSWLHDFPNSRQTTRINTYSYIPILYETNSQYLIFNGFRFEHKWLHMEEISEIIENHMKNNKATSMKNLFEKYHQLSINLKQWSNNIHKKYNAQSKNCKKIIQWVGKIEDIRESNSLEKWLKIKAKLRLENINYLNKIYWKQRSKFNWIKNGDANTNFFHLHTSIKKSSNMIPILKDKNGIEIKDHVNKAKLIFSFYRDLIEKEVINNNNYGKINLNKLYENENFNLESMERNFEMPELDLVVKNWKSNKSSGPDGYISEFLKKYWAILKEEILDLFNSDGCQGLSKFNTSYITLIAKKR